MVIPVCLCRVKRKLPPGFHLFQEGLFPFLPDSSLLSVFFPPFFSIILSAAKNLSIELDLLSNPTDGILQYGFLQLTLPDNNDIPALCLQLAPDFLIAFLVPRYLGHPELRVGFWDRIKLTVFVAMPEAAMHEDNRPIFGQDDIRTSRKPFVVYPVAKSLKP